MQPAKWRETCDPFALNFTRFRLTEVLGYPHAGNDVFHVRGLLDGHEATAYLKVARRPGADIEREIALLAQLCEPIYPKVLDHGASPAPWSLTEELPGQRLSVLLGENESFASISYLPIWRNMAQRWLFCTACTPKRLCRRIARFIIVQRRMYCKSWDFLQ